MDNVVRDLEQFGTPTPGKEYEAVTFQGLRLAGVRLHGMRFTNCTFVGCDLSNVDLTDTGLRTVLFKDCKMLGVRFERCNNFLLRLRFQECLLDMATFIGMPLASTLFQQCRLRECDFSSSDLKKAVFDTCDLAGTVFGGTDLQGSDLRTAQHYLIDPATNKLKGAHFDLHGLPGLLYRHGIIVE